MAPCELCGHHDGSDGHVDSHVPDALIARYVKRFPKMPAALVRACARAHLFTTDHQRRRCRCFSERTTDDKP